MQITKAEFSFAENPVISNCRNRFQIPTIKATLCSM